MKMSALIPILPVASMPRSVEFYCKMLGFEVELRRDEWGWAKLRFGDCRLMVDESIYHAAMTDGGEDRNLSSAANSDAQSHATGNINLSRIPRAVLYFYPDDIAQYHQRVRANGLAIPDLTQTFYGLTEFRITDPDGNPLWIGQTTNVA